METNTIVGMVGMVCISFSLLFIFAIGFVTIVKKARHMYQAGNDQYITAAQAKVITDSQTSLNVRLNKMNANKKE